ncbi:OmpA family protein [Caballeronia humi]|uniref:OmpA family protein n=1 Tax=Caballeronia humi TaxID=326474 RepID=UPI001F326E1D|nr:OmpA family protein [Caballeronia humi]
MNESESHSHRAGEATRGGELASSSATSLAAATLMLGAPGIGRQQATNAALTLQRAVGNRKTRDMILAREHEKSALNRASTEPGPKGQEPPIAKAGQTLGDHSASLIHRVPEEIKTPGWGRTILHDDSWMKFDPSGTVETGTASLPISFPIGADPQTVNLPADTTSGTVRMQVNASWFRNVWDGNLEGSGGVSMNVSFKINADNKIDWGPAQPKVTVQGVGATIQVPVVAGAAGDDVLMSPMINGMGTATAALNTNVGYSANGVQGGVTAGSSTTVVAGGVQGRTYGVKLKVAPIPIQNQSFTAYFAVNSAKVEDQSQTNLVVWYGKLPPAIRKSVEEGTTTIWILGNASTTNTIEYNRNLSENRAKRLRTILQSYTGSRAKIEVKANSYTMAKQFNRDTGAKVAEEDDEARLAEVIIKYESRSAAPEPAGTQPKP